MSIGNPERVSTLTLRHLKLLAEWHNLGWRPSYNYTKRGKSVLRYEGAHVR